MWRCELKGSEAVVDEWPQFMIERPSTKPRSGLSWLGGGQADQLISGIVRVHPRAAEV
jgi:hypothetical protein